MKKILAITFIGTLALASCTKTQKAATSTNLSESERLAQGKTIYESACKKCHDLPNPTDFNATQWVGIMNSMAPKARLTDEQHQMVYDYAVSVKP